VADELQCKNITLRSVVLNAPESPETASAIIKNPDKKFSRSGVQIANFGAGCDSNSGEPVRKRDRASPRKPPLITTEPNPRGACPTCRLGAHMAFRLGRRI
jgi:hypothetical protein